AKAKGLDPLAYMRRFGAFEVQKTNYFRHERSLGSDDLAGAEVDPVTKVVVKSGKALGVQVDGASVEGFPTPSRKLEFTSRQLADWTWPEFALPGYINSHVDWRELDPAAGEFCLLPTFRLPTLIHTRSGAAKWLNEISQCNPLWVYPADGKRL